MCSCSRRSPSRISRARTAPDSLDRLELALRRPDDRVEAPEVGHDPADERLRQARDVGQGAIAARHDGLVERVDAAVVAEHLGEPAELEQLLVRERRQLGERSRRLVAGAEAVVVADDRVALARHVADELLELEPDQAALAAELDAVAGDALRHAGGHLRALQDDEHVVEHYGVLELERGQARQHLLEPLPVRVERPERLVRLREDVRDRVELVPSRPDEDRDRLPLLRDGDDERPRLLRDALGRAVPRARLVATESSDPA